MTIRINTFLFTVLAAAGFAWPLEKFDLIIGIGPSFQTKYNTLVFNNKKNSTDIYTDFTLSSFAHFGYLLNEKVNLNCENRLDIYKPEESYIINNLLSLGIRYSPVNLFKNLSVNSGFGLSSWFYPFFYDWNARYSAYGMGGYIGAGYKISRRIEISFDYQFSQPIHRGKINFRTVGEGASKIEEYELKYNIHSIHCFLNFIIL